MPENSTHWRSSRLPRRPGCLKRRSSGFGGRSAWQPHRVENFKFSKDPQFVEKVRDIFRLYRNPPDHAIVLCVEEKSQGAGAEPNPAHPTAGSWSSGPSIARLRTAPGYVLIRCPAVPVFLRLNPSQGPFIYGRVCKPNRSHHRRSITPLPKLSGMPPTACGKITRPRRVTQRVEIRKP